jgi:hypothetical protein
MKNKNKEESLSKKIQDLSPGRTGEENQFGGLTGDDDLQFADHEPLAFQTGPELIELGGDRPA